MLRRCKPLVLLLLTLAFLAGSDVAAQQVEQGYIVILEPAEWTGDGVRSVAQPVEQSLRIRGLTYHPSGITSVHVNGHPAVLTPSQDSGVVGFTVYLPITSGTEEAFIVAAPRQGSAMIESRSLDLLPAEQFAAEDSTPDLERLEGLGTRWAVIVGISSYGDEAVPALRFAHRDAEALSAFLLSEGAGLGGYDPEKVVLLTNEQATFRNIRTALRGFLTSATEDDQIVFYFAGHGVRDPARPDEYYLLTHDTELDNLAGTALPMSDLEQALGNLRYRDLVLIADACHSGEMGVQVAFRDAFGYNDINDIFRERFRESRGGEVVFTAGEGRDLSQEGERWGGGHGVFTYYLLKGLEGEADVNGDGIVELGEVLEYVRDQVRRDTGGVQNPAIAGGTFDRSLPLAVVIPDLVAEGIDDVHGQDTPEPQDALPEEDDEVEAAVGSPPFTPGGALTRGLLLPGLGQLHTGRLLPAVMVAGGVVAGGALAVRSDVTTRSHTFERPFGGVYTEDVQVQVYPHRNVGIAVAVAAVLGGALEAYVFARRTSGEPSDEALSLLVEPSRATTGQRIDVGLRLWQSLPFAP